MENIYIFIWLKERATLYLSHLSILRTFYFSACSRWKERGFLQEQMLLTFCQNSHFHDISPASSFSVCQLSSFWPFSFGSVCEWEHGGVCSITCLHNYKTLMKHTLFIWSIKGDKFLTQCFTHHDLIKFDSAWEKSGIGRIFITLYNNAIHWMMVYVMWSYSEPLDVKNLQLLQAWGCLNQIGLVCWCIVM